MTWLGGGVLTLVAIVTVVYLFGRSSPKALAAIAKWIGVSAMALVGLFFISRDAFTPGLVVLGTAATWAGWTGHRFPGFAGTARPSPGKQSTVETAWLRMMLDHDTGETEGEVLKGAFAGRHLGDLALGDLRSLWHETLRDDPDSARLLEAYIARRFPDADPSDNQPPHRNQPGTSREEALAVLGLNESATPEEIRAAHKTLMMKFHPDRGGSDYLAAKINAARDYLLGETQPS